MFPNQWIFGGIIFRKAREVFMYAVFYRTKESLIETIEACVEKGSTITSDQWKAYDDTSNLEGHNFKHYIKPNTVKILLTQTLELVQKILKICGHVPNVEINTSVALEDNC